MMKKFFLAALVLLAATSCTNDSEYSTAVENHTEQGYAPVTVKVNDFTITQEEMPSGGGTTRGTESLDNYLKKGGAITLAFYDAEGTEVYKTTQVRGDGTYTTFGQFTANLQVGTYTMVAVAYMYYEGDTFALTSPTEAAFTSERPRESFSKVQSVTVTSASPLDLSITLNRISSKLKIKSTDGRSASATKVRTTLAKGGKAFNPTTGLATIDAGFTQVNNPSSAVDAAIEVNVYPFLFTDEEDIDVTIEVLDDDDNVLFTHTVEDVPFKRNRATVLRGAVFTAGTSGAAFTLETSWLDDETVDF
jgi:hypothetical protein